MPILTQNKFRARIISVLFLLIFLLSFCWPVQTAQAAPLVQQPGCLTSTTGGLIMFGPCPSFTWIQAAGPQPQPIEDLRAEEENYDLVTAPVFDENGHWTMSGEPRTQKARSLLIMARVLEGLVRLAFALQEVNSPPPCQTNIEGAPGLVICPNGMFLNGEPYNPEE